MTNTISSRDFRLPFFDLISIIIGMARRAHLIADITLVLGKLVGSGVVHVSDD